MKIRGATDGPGNVWDERERELVKAVVRLEGKVDALRADVADLKQVHRDRLNSHGERISSLEQSRAKYRGVLAVMAGLLGWQSGDTAVDMARRFLGYGG